jgi:hypothetical protein
MIGENELVLNPVFATLMQQSVLTNKWYCIANLHGWVKLNLVRQ